MFLLRDSIRMIREIRKKGTAIRLWGGALNIPQLVGGVIFIWTIEGLAVLATVILTLVIAGQIHRRAPFSRLTGLCHLPWLALLPWLVWRLVSVDQGWPLAVWLAYVSAAIAISLLFDAWDVARYLRGERRFSWS